MRHEPPQRVVIDKLLHHPQHVPFVAGLVWRSFWADVPGGLTQAYLEQAFGGHAEPGRVLCSLVALDGSQPLGCVHLIDNDATSLPDLHPWLAAMVVVEERRGQGIGSALVRALLKEAMAMGFEELWLGTDGPGFYERLGAREYLCVGAGFRVMRVALGVSGGGRHPPAAEENVLAQNRTSEA